MCELESFRRLLEQQTVVESAKRLLGCDLVTPEARVRIVEAEAYGGPEDLGSHAARGMTPRNAAMFGPPGHAYVYFTYGNHWMLNVVTLRDGTPGAVLIRAARPIEGAPSLWPRRPKARSERDLLSGPGKLAAALDLDRRHNGLDMLDPASVLRLEPREPVATILESTRIGLGEGKGRHLVWRFIDAGAKRWASRG